MLIFSLLLQEELSTSLKKRVHIDSRIGTSTSSDSGIAGLSSTSQLSSSSQLDGTYMWAVLGNGGDPLPTPIALRAVGQRLKSEIHLLKFL